MTTLFIQYHSPSNKNWRSFYLFVQAPLKGSPRGVRKDSPLAQDLFALETKACWSYSSEPAGDQHRIKISSRQVFTQHYRHLSPPPPPPPPLLRPPPPPPRSTPPLAISRSSKRDHRLSSSSSSSSISRAVVTRHTTKIKTNS
ncbi:hypothetical protein E2C01_029158 [Portunus trituberculatus]|uniref:Uncharacterized protein n=1 Tax=Portunus trituberculatus TaxID=210409 RepID=A0A5B7ETW9_PORTR|nr:hypothetical protein [Portunus trituberculatus]